MINHLRRDTPFRLGTTSYIIPADILPNLQYLAGKVQDVELVLFESDAFSNMPTPDDVSAMKEYTQEYDMTFTVHLPLDTALGSQDEMVRHQSVEKCLRVIERMMPVQPFGWILHLHGDQRGPVPSEDIGRWLIQLQKSLSMLLAAVSSSRALCVETLDYDFGLVADLIPRFDLGVCLDIGHLVLRQDDLEKHFALWGERARVLHLHGVDPTGKDHVDLSYLNAEVLDSVLAWLMSPGSPARVLTMEIFGEDDFEKSMKVMMERLNKWQA